MKKGQISFDLLLTMILAIMITTAFLGIISDFKANQENRLAREQLNKIAQNNGLLISSTQIIADTNFLIKTIIPKIKYVDLNKQTRLNYPTIKLADENTLNVSILINGETIDSNFKISKTKNTVIDTTLLEYNGEFVIKNA